MVTINEMVQNLSVKYSNKTKKICEPIERYFGINHFSVTKVMSNGQCFSLGSHVGLQEFYYLEKKFIWNPFHIDPKYVTSGLYFYSHVQCSKFQETLDELRTTLDVSPIFTIYIKEKEQSTRFIYGVNSKLDHFKTKILLNNNIKILNQFNKYFLNEMNCQLKTAWDNSISLQNEMGNNYTSNFNETPIQNNFENRLQFLKEIKKVPHSAELTYKDFEYLIFIAKGMTNKQISQHLNRSIRTVEHYIEVLKIKLCCENKFDLINIAQLFE